MPEFQITFNLDNSDLKIINADITKQGDIVLTLESQSEVDVNIEPFSLDNTVIEKFPALHQVAVNSSLETYLNAIIHDLRNPLSTIIGFADMLASERHLFTEDRIDKIAHEILQAGEKINGMLVALSKRAKKQGN